MRKAFPFFIGGNRGIPLVRELSLFLGKNLDRFPIVTRSFATVDLPNLHLAVTKESEIAGAAVRLLGYKLAFGEHQNSLRELLVRERNFSMARVGPVQYRQVDIDLDQQIQCVQNGLHLIDSSRGKLIAHVRN